jgi:hypothetical protein
VNDDPIASQTSALPRTERRDRARKVLTFIGPLLGGLKQDAGCGWWGWRMTTKSTVGGPGFELLERRQGLGEPALLRV